MFLFLLLVAVTLCAAYFTWTRRRLYRLAKEIPSDMKAYPIIGHAYKFMGNSEDHMKSIQEVGLEANRQGGFSSFWLCIRLFICITDPSTIEVVSKACLDKDNYTTRILRTVLGNGSISAPVNIWHPRRKLLTPFFSLKNLNRLVPLFHEKSCRMLDSIRSNAGTGDFRIMKYTIGYTFESVCESVMGVECLGNTKYNIPRAVKKACFMASKRMIQPWLHLDCIYERMAEYRTFIDHRQELYNFIDEIIQKKRDELSAVGEKDFKNKKHKTFLEATMLPSGGNNVNCSDVELREEVLVMFTAGYDTSAITMSSVAVILSRHPEVQEKLYKEVKEVFGDTDRAVTSRDISKLKYLDAVIKENLRLYPPAPVVVREVHSDIVLPSGKTLVAGSSVLIHIWGTHRNPAYWGADAELFRPERFLEGPLRHPAQFIPFSYSVRNCIGFMYAMLSAKTALINLVRRYRLLPPAGMAAADLAKPLRVKFEITSADINSYVLRVEERKEIKCFKSD